MWQQDVGARFIEALNSRSETFRGISYTNTCTRTDEEVQPSLDATASSSLHTGEGAITDVAVCAQQNQPGVDPLNVENYLQALQLLPALSGVFVPGSTSWVRPRPLRRHLCAATCSHEAVERPDPVPRPGGAVQGSTTA